jgi:cysteine synthase A
VLRIAEEGILSAIGQTPLVRLRRLIPFAPFRLYAKLEGLNPGGSMKDRAAANIIQRAFESGVIDSRSVIVESSSGNMGVGLAQVCAFFGLRFICVIDPKITSQNRRLLKAYGAELEPVEEPDAATGDFLRARLNRVKTLVESEPRAFWPNQYANLENAAAHHHTMGEIAMACDGRVDYVFCATSTCGTLRGCADYIRHHHLATKVVAVDAEGSVIFGKPKKPRMIPGHGAAFVPDLFQPGLADRCVHVSDIDCVVGCRRLAREEAVLAGGSSGAIVSALENARSAIAPGATCVLILADRGERYLDTIYSDSWVLQHFGEISHLWETPRSNQACMATNFTC